MFSKYFLSIIIPAYQEEIRLQKTLPSLRNYLTNQDYSWEVIVVDDGSSDRTARIPYEIFSKTEPVKIIKNPKNRGKGFSVRQGVMEAQGEVILISDADFSTPIEEIEKLQAFIRKGYDITIGSRSLVDSNIEVRQAWYREAMGRIFNIFVQMMVLRGFIDTQCGFKCFDREKTLPIFSQMMVDGFCFDVEFLFIAKKQGLKIIEVPVKWKHVPFSRVSLISDPIQMLLDLMSICKNNKKGLYR
ncbi:MAG TPA: glycosyltransferase family 2 protein [Nitrospinaceae bacterium]|nr:glycosyltransferase family 2 protein [Nitrospinaceae bacterium]HIN87448.1 glycosyltransferase family 2 protein [Nitrospinaceae bacterium]